MANPMTILSFGALFAGLGVTSGATGDAALVVLGVLLGSTTWWIVLTTVVGDAADAASRPPGSIGSTSPPASIIGAFAIVSIASVLVPVAGRP